MGTVDDHVTHGQGGAEVPRWSIRGDWFDACNCTIPCPCTWAQPPTQDTCSGVLAWRIREGQYGDIDLAGLNVVVVGLFTGSLWGGDGRGRSGAFIDIRADDRQHEALGMIFSGQAGGWPAVYAHLIEMDLDVPFLEERAVIDFQVAEDLTSWRVEVPGRLVAGAEVLRGPATPDGALVQVLNAPGSDTGPGQVSTWGRTTVNDVDALGFRWHLPGRSSKHIPFDWSGPDGA